MSEPSELEQFEVEEGISPMTISLEEHVARPSDKQLRDSMCCQNGCARKLEDRDSSCERTDLISELLGLRAAIAALREREGAGSPCPHCGKEFPKCGCWSDAPDRAEAMRAKTDGSRGKTLVSQIIDQGPPYPWEPDEGDIRVGKLAKPIAALKGNGEGP